jgi:hypothetical protein
MNKILITDVHLIAGYVKKNLQIREKSHSKTTIIFFLKVKQTSSIYLSLILIQKSQNLMTIFGDQNLVFNLSRPTAIDGSSRPAVIPDIDIILPLGEDWFNSETHSWFHDIFFLGPNWMNQWIHV